MGWVYTVLFGVILGAAAAAADAKADGLDQTPAWLALAMVLNAGCVWAALGVLCGRVVVTPVRAALAGPLGLACAVAGYYTYGLFAGDRTDVGFAGLTGVIRYWLVAAVVLGPVLGLVGVGTRHPGPIGVITALVVPVGAAIEMFAVRRLGRLSDDPAMLWAQLGIVVVAAVVAAITIVRARRPVEGASH